MRNRRELLKTMGIASATALLPGVGKSSFSTAHNAGQPFTYCLNMATIRGHNLGFIKELELASKAGFKSVEIWIDSLEAFLSKGGTVKDAAKRINDLGITVENAIGFATWIVDDAAKRKAGLDQIKREMDTLAQIGCKRIAAPPMGATGLPVLDLKEVAERYRTILELGDTTGVKPQLEMWGFSKNLSRVSDVMYVALESGHPDAKILLDVYHLYKGGSSIDTLSLINTASLDILHVNDYPAHIAAASITDADRIYPGDGVAPISRILKTLKKEDSPLVISVEVFNKNYYSQDPLLVAQTALKKMKAITDGI